MKEVFFAICIYAAWRMLIFDNIATFSVRAFKFINRKPLNCGLCLSFWLCLLWLLVEQQTLLLYWPVCLAGAAAIGKFLDTWISYINDARLR